MGQQIPAGAAIIGGAGAGDLGQYYGYADTNQTTVTATSLTQLSTAYVIPANEPYAGAAYKLECGGYGQQGSTAESPNFNFLLNSTQLFTNGWCQVAAASLAASTQFSWKAVADITCEDGVQFWLGTLTMHLSSNSTPWTVLGPIASNGAAINVPVNAPITCLLQMNWNSATGAPTITTTWTKFKKEA